MGSNPSKSPEISQKEKEIQLCVAEWIALRNRTIAEIDRVANELEDIHRKATYSRIAGGIAGAIGGGIVLTGVALSFFTGGASLLLTGTGLTIAAGGGVTATVTEVVEYLKKKTRLDNAQKSLENDRATQNEVISKIKDSIDTANIDQPQKKKFNDNLTKFVDSVHRIWVTGMRVYGWAKSGQAMYSTVKWARAGQSVWKYGATQGLKRTLMTVGSGVASSIFILVDLGYVVHHAIQIRKGTPSDAAKSLRDVRRLLVTERDRVIALVNSH